MYFIFVVLNLLLLAANADNDNSTVTIEAEKVTNDFDKDMLSLLFLGMKKALKHINSDLPFLTKLTDEPDMKMVNTSIDDMPFETDNLRQNNSLLKAELRKKPNENRTKIMRQELLQLAKDLLSPTLSELIGTNVTAPSLICKACKTLDTLNCNAPLNKDLPKIVCNNSKEICYSTHSPFGIVERGCINILKHVNVYVCKYNLCNNVHMSEIPVVFTTKLKWIENVFEISYRRHLQGTVFKGMSCLKCEVNFTREDSDLLDDANCLEGNTENLPVEVCEEDQVCAVKAVRDQGYIWRGCVSKPLYNYWWSFCDTALCNNDTLATIYDETLAV